MIKVGGNTNVCYEAKESNLHRLSAVRFQSYMVFWQREARGDTKAMGDGDWGAGGRAEQAEHRGSVVLPETVLVNVSLRTLVQTHTRCNTYMNACVHYGLWGIMCQCWFYNWNDIPLRWGTVTIVGAVQQQEWRPFICQHPVRCLSHHSQAKQIINLKINLL